MTSSNAHPKWRGATMADLEVIQKIGDEIHINLPERPEVFAEKFNLFPEGCFVLTQNDTVVGYGFSHPWLLRSIPPLDTFLGVLRAWRAKQLADAFSGYRADSWRVHAHHND
jgi:hypothetical protein